MMRRFLFALCGMLAACACLSVQAQEVQSSQTFERVARTGTIFLAYSEGAPPFSYALPGQDRPLGYSWDVCLSIVKQIEARIGKSLTVVPVVTGTNSRFLTVKAGMAELECGATTNTVARQKLANFSNTIYVAETRILAKSDLGARGFADLAGKRVATVNGSTAERLVQLAMLQRGLALTLVSTRTQAEAVRMLEAGEVDAIAGVDAALALARANSKLAAQLTLLPESMSVEPYGLMLPVKDAVFKKFVDETLVGMMKSGELAAIYDKWFVQPIAPWGVSLGLPLSELNKGTFAYPNDRPAN